MMNHYESKKNIKSFSISIAVSYEILSSFRKSCFLYVCIYEEHICHFLLKKWCVNLLLVTMTINSMINSCSSTFFFLWEHQKSLQIHRLCHLLNKRIVIVKYELKEGHFWIHLKIYMSAKCLPIAMRAENYNESSLRLISNIHWNITSMSKPFNLIYRLYCIEFLKPYWNKIYATSA